MTLHLTPEQHTLLLKKIHKDRVSTRDGMAYVEAHDDKAHLIRIFGFGGFSSEVIEQNLIFEEQVQTRQGKPAWYVAYRSVVKLTVHDQCGHSVTYTEGHVGDSTHPVRGEAHGNAVANSESYALKRCCVFLGDQYGLSLYNKGQQDAIVRWTLVTPPATESSDEQPNTDDIPAVHRESLELPEAPPDPRTVSAPSAPAAPPVAAEPAAGAGTAPSPAAEPPADVEAQRQKKAQDIRDRAVGDIPAEYRGKPAKWIAHLMGEAVKAGVLSARVESLWSKELIELKALLEQALKQATSPEAPRERSA